MQHLKEQEPVECSNCDGTGELERIIGERKLGNGNIEPIVRTWGCDECHGGGLGLCRECGETPAYANEDGEPRCSEHIDALKCPDCRGYGETYQRAHKSMQPMADFSTLCLTCNGSGRLE